MKSLVLSVVLMASLPILGQDQSKRIPSDFQIFRKAGHYQIESRTATDRFTAAANSLEWIDRTACLIRLTGDVEISTKGVTLQADEADYHCGTSEFEPRGNVVFKPYRQQ